MMLVGAVLRVWTGLVPVAVGGVDHDVLLEQARSAGPIELDPDGFILAKWRKARKRG